MKRSVPCPEIVVERLVVAPQTAARPGRSAFLQTLFTGVGIQILTILTGVVMARILGPDGRGLFAAAQLWPVLVAGASFFGLNHALTLRAAAHREDAGALYSTALCLSLLLSTVALVGCALVVPRALEGQPEVIAATFLYLPFIPIFMSASLLNSVDIGLGTFRDYNLMRWSLIGVNVLSVLILVGLGVDDPRPYLLGLIAANGVALLVKLIRLPWTDMRPTFRHAAVITAGGVFHLASLATLARDQIERLFLVTAVDTEALGIYVVAFSAAMMPSVLAKSLGLVVFARSTVGGEAAYADTARLFRQLVLFNFVLSVGTCITLPPLIPLMYGAAFVPASAIVLVLIPAQFAIALSSILDEGLRGRNRAQFGVLGVSMMVVVFVALAFPLSQRFGALGVAVAATAGHAGALTILVVAFKRAAPHAQLFPGVADSRALLNGALGAVANLPLRRRRRDTAS